MARHIIDKTPKRTLGLPLRRFLAFARRQRKMATAFGLARTSWERASGRQMQQFCQIDRRGLDNI